MRKIDKKGELTTQKLVTIIVLITSFVIILFLLFRLNWGATTADEICHNSVVLKSKGKGLVGGLDCKTSYVCISGGGDCEGINPTETIDVSFSGEDEIIKKEIMKAMADEMADCWWMFGEGELAYLGTDFQGDHCAICSIVKFDGAIQEKFSEITYSEFYNYLLVTEKSNTKSYLKYLYGVFSLDSVQEFNRKVDIDSEKIITTEKFVIVTGINPNWPNADGKIFPCFVKYNEVTDKTDCDVFDLTKA
jgi:hypothetical protein